MPAISASTIIRPEAWNEKHEPNSATKATITKAAPTGGKRLVITGIHGTIACGSTAQTPIRLQLSAGATVIKSWSVAAPANGMGGYSEELGRDEEIVLDVEVAAKLEFSAAGVTDSVQTVSLSGYVLTP